MTCKTCGAGGTWRAEHADWCWTVHPDQPVRGDVLVFARTGPNRSDLPVDRRTGKPWP